MFPQFPKQGRNKRLVVTSLSSAVLLVCLCSCQTTQPDITGSLGDTGPAASHSDPKGDSRGDPRGEINAYRDRFRANPKDPDTALSYARALRAAGERAQAVAVLEQATIANPKNKVLLAGYGRALADNGNFEQAFDVLSQAHSPEDPDWRILSVQGAVLDQQGKFEEARQYYASALRIAPDEPSVLSNLGLSYMLSKDLGKAEEALRKAHAHAGNDRRIRMNLAVVLGLEGRMAEAESIARANLPVDEANADVAELKRLLNRKDNARGSSSDNTPVASIIRPN
jgi:Flp pilus assembly protein TadD